MEARPDVSVTQDDVPAVAEPRRRSFTEEGSAPAAAGGE